MKPDTQRLNNFWREQLDTFVEQLADDIKAHAGPGYATMPRDRLLDIVKRHVQAWLAALEAGDPAQLVDLTHTAASQRIDDGIEISEVMRGTDAARERIWRLMAQLYAAGDWDMDVVEMVERWLHEVRKAVVDGYSGHFQEASERLAERERALADQSRLIQELSVPIVPIHEGVLGLPLVGAI